MYGVGQGLERGVGMAAPLIMNAITNRAQMDQRERLFNREMAANAGILAGNTQALRPKARTVGATPGELLAGGPGPAVPPSAGAILHEGSSDPMPRRPPMAAQPQTVGAGPLAGVEDDPTAYTPLTEEQVYEMYRRAADERTQGQIRMADEMDVARGWQKNYAQLSDLTRTLRVIESALKDETGNRAMVLVPHAQNAAQATQILASEQLKLRQRHQSALGEFKLWDQKRREFGIDEKAINTEPGIAQWLNRRNQDKQGMPTARPGARSIVPAPQRGR